VDQGRDRRDVADEIKSELFIERCVDRVGCGGEEKHITVRTRVHDRLGAEIAACPWPVLDYAGGLRAAVIRALLYAGMVREGVDERGFEMVRRLRRSHGEMPLSEFKALVREQFLILLVAPDAALAAPAQPECAFPAATKLRKVKVTRSSRWLSKAEKPQRRPGRLLQASMVCFRRSTRKPIPRNFSG
jgi:hypothetical protein